MSFEHIDCRLETNNISVRLAVVYRPPPSKVNSYNTNIFLDHRWPKYLSEDATTDMETVIVGGVNFRLDRSNDRDTMKCNNTLQLCGMQQFVREPTHVRGHTLDVVISRDDSNIVSDVYVTGPGICDLHGNMT